MPASPFHRGEQDVQARLGVRDKVERMGRNMIRSFLPEQHREFYAQLDFIIVGSYDDDGAPWASIVPGAPGFVDSPDPEHLRIDAMPLDHDPLHGAWRTGARLGLLGIQLQTRRRNRATGHVVAADRGGIDLAIDQTFGNCPQYIQTRTPRPDRPAEVAVAPVAVERLDDGVAEFIRKADTFFVASYVANGDGQASDGVDVSHRGGRPGFVRVDDERRLTIPDYRGNFIFNTLGNFVANPKAGMLFVDWATGDVLTLSGNVEIVWEPAEAERLEGAQRLWRFELQRGWRLNGALAQRWAFGEYSPQTLRTGTWR